MRNSKFVKFPDRDATDVEPKATDVASYVSSQHLADFRSLYHIPRDHELIRLFSMSGQIPPSQVLRHV